MMSGIFSVQGIGGLLVLFVGIYMLRDGLVRLKTWPRAQGTVVDVIRLTGLLTPEVEFTDADGRTRRFFARMPWRQRKGAGATMPVMYDPKGEDEPQRVSIMGSVGAPILTAAFGFSLAYCTVFACR